MKRSYRAEKRKFTTFHKAGILFMPEQIELIKTGSITQTLRRSNNQTHLIRLDDGCPVFNIKGIEKRFCCPHLRFGNTLYLKDMWKQRKQDNKGYIEVEEKEFMYLGDIDDEIIVATGAKDLEEFVTIWNLINHKSDRWERNPLVWRLKFRYIGNINEETKR